MADHPRLVMARESVQVMPASVFGPESDDVTESEGLSIESLENASRFWRMLKSDSDKLDEFLTDLNASERFPLVNSRLPDENFYGPYSHGTPLAYAIVKDNAVMVETLLRFGADARMSRCVVQSNPTADSKEIHSHLHLALHQFCQPKVIRRLLDFGAHPASDLSKNKQFAVMEYISRCTDKALAAQLLYGIGDVTIVGDYNHTVLHLAVKEGNVEVVKLLLSLDADVNQGDQQGNTALMYAVKQKSSIIADLLLAKGALVNQTDCHGRTALHFAVKAMQVEMIRMLLKEGADVDVQSNSGVKPIEHVHKKQKNGGANAPLTETKAQVVELLLASSDGPYTMTETQFTNIAFLLVWHGSVASSQLILKLLRDNKGHISVAGDSGQTLVHAAAMNAKDEILGWLLDNGLKVNAEDSEHWLPIHYAALAGHKSSIDVLLTHGACIDDVTSCGWSPIWLLLRHGHQKAALDIIRRGSGGCDISKKMSLNKIRQAVSDTELPTTLFDPAKQKESPVKYAKQGRKKLTLLDFAHFMGYSGVVRELVLIGGKRGSLVPPEALAESLRSMNMMTLHQPPSDEDSISDSSV